MSAPNLSSRAARGMATLAGGRAVVFSLQFATMAILAGHLGPSRLGVFTFALATLAVFRVLPNFGLVPIVTRDIAQSPERERELLPTLIYLRILLGLVAYVLLAATVLLGFEGEERRGALIAGLVLLVIFDAFRSILEVRLRMGWISIADTIEAALTVAGTATLAVLGAGVEPFLWLYVGLKILNATIVTAAASRLASFDWRPRPALWPPLLRAAVPLGLASVVQALYYRLDILLLAAFTTPFDVGQYGAAYRFLEAFTVLPAMTMAVLGPILARSVVEGAEALQRRYSQALHLLTIPSILVAVAGGLTAWRVLPLLPGFGQYEGGGVALAILSPAAGLILLGTLAQGLLVSGHQQQRLLAISGVGLVFNIILNLILIPTATYIGAAIATTLTEGLLLWMSVREVRKRMGVRHLDERSTRLGIATLILTGVLVAGFLVHPALQLILGVGAFGVALWKLRVLEREDLAPFLGRLAQNRG